MVRFDQPCHQVASALNYFRVHMQKQEYLASEGQAPMEWFGAGAERLGLSSPVEAEDFARLCAGRHPQTKEKLFLRDNGASRRVCYFGQISAPKDVSIANLVAGDQRLAGWWQESVKETLQEIEKIVATRVRLGGATDERATGNLVAAVVTHDTSRALDPQLHTHVCVMNVTFDAVEDRWKAVEPRGFYHYQSYLREVSYNKLAEKMKEGGYRLENARSGGFTIAGFPAELREMFGKRRAEIERVAALEKTRAQDALQSIAIRTRAAKVNLSPEELRSRWNEEAAPYLAAVRQVVEATQRHHSPTTMTAAQVLGLAEAHVFERLSVIDERFLLREALVAGRGEVTLNALKEALTARLGSGDLIQTGRLLTSRETLALEKSIIAWAGQGKGAWPVWGRFTPQPALSPEQNRAVEQILGSRNRVIILIGDAGSGKSTTLSALVQGIQATGQLTFACAPSSSATQELQEKLKIQAETVQQLLINQKLQEQVAGRTLIIDEAGLLSIRQMHELSQLAERQKCRLLLVGDTKQHHSVEAGDALRALQKYAEIATVRLQEIHRQKEASYRRVVQLLARGQADAALDQLDRLGGIKEERPWDKLLDRAAQAYVEKVQAGQSCLAISPVWSEVNAFTAVLRNHLKEHGLLGKDERTYQAVSSLQWTRAQRQQVRHYQPGDILTFHREESGFTQHELATVVAKTETHLLVKKANGSQVLFDPKKGNHFDVGLPRLLAIAPGERLLVRANFAPARLKNGDLVTVTQVQPDGSLLLSDQRLIPSHFRQFTHGYATTSHAAQGKTVDHGLLILGEKGLQAANLRQAYVSNSRFRLSQTILTVDQPAATAALARDKERSLALEAIKTICPENQTSPKEADPVEKRIQKGPLDWNPAVPKMRL